MNEVKSYKNTSKLDQTLVGFGVVPRGKVIETNEEINHPAFKLVDPAPANDRNVDKDEEVKVDE